MKPLKMMWKTIRFVTPTIFHLRNPLPDACERHRSDDRCKSITLAFSLPLILAGLIVGPSLLAQMDDFSDGNDTGWTRMNPLAGLGVGGTGVWSFPEGGYRIQAGGVTATTYGPARVGSYLSGADYGQFYLTCDIVSWNNSLDQIFGLLARVGGVGLGGTRGYAFTYATRAGRNPAGELELLRVTAESGTDLPGADVDFTLQPGEKYRFVFTGNGSLFSGQVFNLTNLVTPLITISSTDATYASGQVGVFTYDNSSSEMNPVDVTFDNFFVDSDPPPLLAVSRSIPGTAIVSWPTSPLGYVLEATPAFAPGLWTEITTGIQQSGSRHFYVGDTGESPRFYRLKKPWAVAP